VDAFMVVVLGVGQLAGTVCRHGAGHFERFWKAGPARCWLIAVLVFIIIFIQNLQGHFAMKGPNAKHEHLTAPHHRCNCLQRPAADPGADFS
jgi:hypothetical protein